MGYSGEVCATRVQSRAPGRARGEPKKLLTYTAARGAADMPEGGSADRARRRFRRFRS